MCAVLDLFLASTSPRRRELLTSAGIRFQLCEPGPEYAAPGMDHYQSEAGVPMALALERARRKAHGARAPQAGIPVLGVDTVVDVDGEELGKPLDRAEAERMQRRLSGRRHEVHTAHVLVATDGSSCEEVTSSTVLCRTPAEAELQAYLDSDEWRGKAGAYGIQDQGQAFLRVESGAMDTVIGLHVAAVRRLLAALRAKA
jgi:septum formation protein